MHLLPTRGGLVALAGFDCKRSLLVQVHNFLCTIFMCAQLLIFEWPGYAEDMPMQLVL